MAGLSNAATRFTTATLSASGKPRSSSPTRKAFPKASPRSTWPDSRTRPTSTKPEPELEPEPEPAPLPVEEDRGEMPVYIEDHSTRAETAVETPATDTNGEAERPHLFAEWRPETEPAAAAVEEVITEPAHEEMP